jgi:beta-galactosidase
MKYFILSVLFVITVSDRSQAQVRTRADFDGNWKFFLGDDSSAKNPNYNDASWRTLNLPHDWSIEGKFDSTNPAGIGGGALPGGTGWYRKTFTVPAASRFKNVFIDFDGVYHLSEVWINGHYLGMRPNGYISFRYDLTPYLKFGDEKNVIAVRVNNSDQPNSRWYSGSGIYRNVWLVTTNKIHVDQWGTFITATQVSPTSATLVITTQVNNLTEDNAHIVMKTMIEDAQSKTVATEVTSAGIPGMHTNQNTKKVTVDSPVLWSTDHPVMYKAVTEILNRGKVIDKYITPFGIRSFYFDADKGFFLNGKHVKIQGVCDHHDLGALGAVVNTRAIQRQLEILKSFGCNAIRTSHNPPAPELLDLCDQMGFVVMDEAFDCWERPKVKYDYHLYFDKWHEKDLRDQIERDRNHPCIFMWSVGNEIPEQSAYKWDPETKTSSSQRDTSGKRIVRELCSIVRSLDTTRPIITANDHPDSSNQILQTNVLDLIGFNYHQYLWKAVFSMWPKKPFLSTESVSAYESRGYYNMPSDSIMRWPEDWRKPFTDGNKNLTCSSYDNCSASWGSTHEESLKEFLKEDYLAGMFVWTGFDYIGEPTPYSWPARSSYFGIVDLAGFPKDAYYLYQSVWTNKPVLHLLPHWNWSDKTSLPKYGDSIDVWAYYNDADRVELFLNGKSLGMRAKSGDALHVMWRVKYDPGTLMVVSSKNGKKVLADSVRTAGKPAKIVLSADRNSIDADGKDLSFVTVKIEDAGGNLIPNADNEVQFKISGDGFIAGVDNGSETSMESFKADHRKAFSGMCLAIIQSNGEKGTIELSATSQGLQAAKAEITAK